MKQNQRLKHIALTAVCAAILSACGGGGGDGKNLNTLSTNAARDVAAVNRIHSAIDALPSAEDLTADDVEGIQAAVDGYNNLSAGQKSLVKTPSLEKLKSLVEAAVAASGKAAAVARQINALPKSGDEIDTAEEDTRLENANAAYTALGANNQTWLADADKNRLATLNKEVAENISGANAAIEKLPAADALVFQNVAALEAAQNEYGRLSPAQKAQVAHSGKLENLVQVAADAKKAADAVTEQIGKLPKSGDEIDTAEEDTQLENANTAYTALGANNQTWLAAADKNRLATLNKEVAENINGANAAIEKLPAADALVFQNVAALEAAQNEYGRLSPAQKAQVAQSGKLENLVQVAADAKKAADAVTEQIGKLPATADEITDVHGKELMAVSTAYQDLGSQKQTWVGKEEADKLNRLNQDFITDIAPLAALNRAEPLHTSFIKSAAAQQNNPHMQQRNVGGSPALRDDQIGLIRSLELNPNEGIKFDAVIYNKKEEDGPVNFSSPEFTINKVFSGGISDGGNQNAGANLAYIKKDRDGLAFDKFIDGVYVIEFEDGTRVTLHDSATAGWHDQTFLHYTRDGITHGYQSIGDETPVSAMPVSGTATYKGITTGYLTQNGASNSFTANVTAVADFGRKGLRFATENAHIHRLQNGVRVSTKADAYNLRGNTSWAAGSNSFKGNVSTSDKAFSGVLNGKFYGANAAEIGGTYGLQNSANTEQLIGGYGAKRQ